MTQAHRIEAVLSADGTLVLEHLPFKAGQVVEVLVVPIIKGIQPSPQLHGAIISYDDPMAPAVPETDWEALQ